MNEIKPVKLGKRVSGTVSQGTYVSEKNDPAPIVLWSKGTVAAVLGYSHKADARTGAFTQKINLLSGGGDGLKAMFDDYPITFKGKVSDKKDERLLDAIEPQQIITADIDGDGVEELVVVRHLGSIDVYNRQKRLFQYALTSARTDLYEYSLRDSHKVSLDAHEVVFLVIGRDSFEDSSHFSSEDQAFDRQTGPFTVLRIDPHGIQVVELDPPGWKIDELIALGVVNRPGSAGIDELAVCSRRREDQALYLSRHTPGGALLGSPRKIYVDLDDADGLRFMPVLQSLQLVAYNPFSKNLYFIRPDKKANWIRHIDLQQRLDREGDIQFLSPFRHDEKLLAAVRQERDLFILDEDGLFYVWQEKGMASRNQPQAAWHIRAESPLHTLVDLRPAGGQSVRFLATQSRQPQTRRLSDADLEQAADRFLPQEELADCEGYKNFYFNDGVAAMAEIFCEERELRCPEITSLEDIRTKLPAFFQELTDQAEASFHNCLEQSLLYPLLREDPSPDKAVGIGIKDKEAYQAWLKSMYVEGETVFTVIDLKGQPVSHARVPGYHIDPMVLETELHLPVVAYGHDRGQGRSSVVTSLSKRPMFQPDTSRYYLLCW